MAGGGFICPQIVQKFFDTFTACKIILISQKYIVHCSKCENLIMFFFFFQVQNYITVVIPVRNISVIFEFRKLALVMPIENKNLSRTFPAFMRTRNNPCP